MKNLKTLSLIGLTSSALLLSGCFSSSSNKQKVDFQGVAVVQTVSSDESQIAFTNGIDKVAERYATKTENDYTVIANGEYFYHLGKQEIDTIQKYHIDTPSKQEYAGEGYSLRKAGDTVSANPHNMAFVNDNTAIITRYGSTQAWVVNTNAANAEDFLIKELDLSSHATGENDTIPEMEMVFVYKDKAFITLQNLTNWASTGNEKVVVFDTKTWQEVDTAPNQEGVQAISLSLKNHQTAVQVGNKVYLGSLVYADNTGGIEVVNLDTYQTTTLFDDIGVNKLTATISGKVFFSSYEGWEVNSLYKLNDNNSYDLISNELKGINISALAAKEEALWVGYGNEGNFITRLDARKDFSQPQPLEKIKLSQVKLSLLPIKIDFIETKTEIVGNADSKK